MLKNELIRTKRNFRVDGFVSELYSVHDLLFVRTNCKSDLLAPEFGCKIEWIHFGVIPEHAVPPVM